MLSTEIKRNIQQIYTELRHCAYKPALGHMPDLQEDII